MLLNQENYSYNKLVDAFYANKNSFHKGRGTSSLEKIGKNRNFSKQQHTWWSFESFEKKKIAIEVGEK